MLCTYLSGVFNNVHFYNDMHLEQNAFTDVHLYNDVHLNFYQMCFSKPLARSPSLRAGQGRVASRLRAHVLGHRARDARVLEGRLPHRARWGEAWERCHGCVCSRRVFDVEH